MVGQYQWQMLIDLGLLSGTAVDYNLYIGALLLVIVAMLSIVLLQQLLDSQVFGDIRRISVIMLITVLNVGLCVLLCRFANLYVAPVAMGSMLLTSLLGWRCGVPAGVGLSLLGAGIAAAGSNLGNSEATQLLLMNLAGAPVSASFLSVGTQRMRVVLCGLLVAVSDAACSMAVGLMTSCDMQSLIGSMVWYVAGAILSGVLALGLQPVFESVFNLATPSKLQELSNP